MPLRSFAYISILASAITSAGVDARMYQWTNAATGTIQLSGSAPGWYRHNDPGPRVLVFDNGQLVDDTAVAVPEPQRARLRASALGASANGHAIAKAPPKPPGDLRLGSKSDSLNDDDAKMITEQAGAQARQAEPPAGSVEQTVSELKSLLDAWDARRLLEAQDLLREVRGRDTSTEARN